MEDNLVEVIFSTTASYTCFYEWINDINQDEFDMWVTLLNKEDINESEFEILAKKSIELYCLDMGIKSIPADETYIHKIISEFIVLFFMHKLIKDGFVKVFGNLCFGINVPFETTESGTLFFETNLKENKNV